jgi:hypothetical protein
MDHVPADQMDHVISAVSPDLLTHSLWRNANGAWMTQCGKYAVTSQGAVPTGWRISFPGNPVSSSWHCKACRRAM